MSKVWWVLTGRHRVVSDREREGRREQMESSSTERSVWCQWGTIVWNFYLGNTQNSREFSVKKPYLLIANTTHSLQVPTGTLEYNIR